MTETYFQPWLGNNYKPGGTLILSESVYDWSDLEGQTFSPGITHPQSSVEWGITNFGAVSYFKQMNRALCIKKQPTTDEMRTVWNRYAYTIYVQGTVGRGAGTRPSRQQWEAAKSSFLETLEQLRPSKVIVTGLSMWDRMPDCVARLVSQVQAYELADGTLVWCLAIPHPSNRRTGFRWREVGESIRTFEGATLPPTRESAGLSSRLL